MRVFTAAAAHTEVVRQKILPLKERARVRNDWLMKRLLDVLPMMMGREGIDMWVVTAREYNEDPVIMTLLPEPAMSARRRTILVFSKQPDGSVQRLTASRYGVGEYYKAVWDPDKEEQWACLARLIRKRDPKTIGLNISHTFAFGDGLSKGEYDLMKEALGPELMARTKSAESLCIAWLEHRTPEEIMAYSGIVDIAHSIIAEAFSPSVIHPGVTTTDDVVWWIRQKILDMGLQTWFQPSIDIESADESARGVILPGDLLHCDVGIKYLGLCTDTQHNAYVLKLDETDAPEGLKAALKTGNRFQDIVTGEFVAGRTGNQILKEALGVAKTEGIDASLYTHPLGYHGHAAGPTIGLWDAQHWVEGRGDYRLYDATCHALELNIKQAVPEWGGKPVRMALEEDILFKDGRVFYLGGRQTRLYLV